MVTGFGFSAVDPPKPPFQIEVTPTHRQDVGFSGSGEEQHLNDVADRLVGFLLQGLVKTSDFFLLQITGAIMLRVRRDVSSRIKAGVMFPLQGFIKEGSQQVARNVGRAAMSPALADVPHQAFDILPRDFGEQTMAEPGTDQSLVFFAAFNGIASLGEMVAVIDLVKGIEGQLGAIEGAGFEGRHPLIVLEGNL